MPHGAQVIIIGAGIMGASIAYHLAIRGCTDVVILEKEATEVSGSTARSMAGVRHQFSSRTNILLSQYSIERFKHFYEEVGGHAELRQIGYLLLVDNPVTWETYQQSVALQRSMGVQVELLDPSAAAAMIPELNQAGLVGATFGPEDGYVDPHGVAMGYLNRARALGVQLQRSTAVTGVQAQGQGFLLQTTNGTWVAETVVNAAGAWAGDVARLAGFAVPVRPVRRNVFVTQPFPQMPTIPLTIDVGSGFYMRKEGAALLLGRSREDEPTGYNLTIDWSWLDSLLEAGFARFPILEQAALNERQSWAGLYEVTPDHMPVLGRMPNNPQWLNAAGFSGHGVMHAPATGLLIAEEILDGRAHSIEIDELRVERFGTQLVGELNVY